LRIGFLLQPQYEASESPALGGVSHNLIVHRARVLFLASLLGKVDFFFETDFADIFRPNAEGVKSAPGTNIIDAFLSYKVLGEQLRVDAGYMLPPLSRNALQGAINLYGLDYFANTFRHSNSFNTSSGPAGRDVGVELRGQILNHLEYRVGVFQGVRDPVATGDAWVGADNPFRFAGRLQVNVLDFDPFFFYGGSYLGQKQILSFGASYDFQERYKYWAVDGTLDVSLGDGVLTGQVDLAAWDGGSSIPGLPEQKALMGELGYSFNALRLAPILRAEQRWVDAETAAVPDETRLGGGLAYWLYGHNFNLKAFYTHVSPEPAAHGYNVFQLQAQWFLL
jgi:hypothetical protein